MSAFFAILSRQKHIKRWGLMRNSSAEDVAQHTAQCAMLAHALAVIGNRRLGRAYDPAQAALRALYHESAEVLTGDLATPVKYFDQNLRDAYKRIETLAEQRLLQTLPQDMQEEYSALLTPPIDDIAKIVKAADRLCAYLKCVEELQAGNQEFESAARATLAKLSEMDCPEASIFLEEFAPAFGLTIDEISL